MLHLRQGGEGIIYGASRPFRSIYESNATGVAFVDNQFFITVKQAVFHPFQGIEKPASEKLKIENPPWRQAIRVNSNAAADLTTELEAHHQIEFDY
jgi:hypothetical protein